MTLKEISAEYKEGALALSTRLTQVRAQLARAKSDEKDALRYRIKLLRAMHHEARELAVLTERYYERGYHRNGRYSL